MIVKNGENLENTKRVLLKLSGEALQGDYEYGIDVHFLEELSKKVVKLTKERNLEIVIIIGGGNIFRGVSGAAEGLDRATGDYMGMLATVMNGMALGDFIESSGQEVRIMSALDVPRVSETFIRRRAIKHLDKGRVVVSVAGTGNPYFTTDSAAVLRALELGCDVMVKGTKVDGIYDKDPFKDENAKRYEKVSFDEALNKGLKIMDQSAIALAKDEKLPIFVGNIDDIDKIGTKDFNGTYVYTQK